MKKKKRGALREAELSLEPPWLLEDLSSLCALDRVGDALVVFRERGGFRRPLRDGVLSVCVWQ